MTAGDEPLLLCGECEGMHQVTVARLEVDPAIECPHCGVVTTYNVKEVRRAANARAFDDQVSSAVTT